MANIVHVNMTDLSVKIEPVPEKYARLGGRGLTSRILFDEVSPQTHPLGEGNKLVIAPGFLSGTSAPSSGRLSVGAKSPLTGGIKESNVGGTAARKLANLGIRAIVIEGRPEDKGRYTLKVSAGGIELIPAGDLRGHGNYQTVASLQGSYGEKVCIISIGQAGEQMLSAASIAVTDTEGRPCRHCGRGGLGAVMGSKGLKALVLDDTGAREGLIEIKEVAGFRSVAREWSKVLIDTKQALKKYGTAVTINAVIAIDGLPTRNYSAGCFEGADKLRGEVLAETINSRGGKTGHACSPGCVIQCSNIFNDAEGRYVTSGLEYETIVLCGSNCGIDNLDAIAKIDYICDDYGMDTMDIGAAIAITMEAGILKFGDAAGAIELLHEIRKGSIIGRVLGNGAVVTSRVFGVTRVPAVKGQAMAGYEPRALKGTGTTYATSPMGADHTAGNCLPGRGNVDPNRPDGQVEVSRMLQYCSTVLDIMGLCIFVGPLPDSMEWVAKLMTHVYGTRIEPGDLAKMAEDTLRTEKEFNRKAGFTEADDRLPEFFRKESLDPRNLVFDVKDEDLDRVLPF